MNAVDDRARRRDATTIALIQWAAGRARRFERMTTKHQDAPGKE